MKRVALVVVLLGAILAVGCGGPPPKEQLQSYVDSVAPWVEKINDAGAKVDKVYGSLKPVRDAAWTKASKALGSAITVFDDAAAAIKAIEPPADLVKANGQAVTAITDMSEVATLIKKALDEGVFNPGTTSVAPFPKLLKEISTNRAAWSKALKAQADELGVTIPWAKS